MCLKRHQPAMSIEEQIKNLRNLKLIIPDEDHARSMLGDVSYFRLIKAYSLGLKQKNSNYNKGITFEMIEELYLFNSNFRQLIFPFVERIEINLRCRISNYFSEKYGVLGYYDSANFMDAEHHDDFISDIEAEIERNKRSPFVKNFKDNYEDGTLPLYAVVELCSFGNLSKFFKNMKNADKKAIASMYGVGYTYLESWFEHISFVRNICAHYGRIYNYKFPKSPRLYDEYTHAGIQNNRIFATLLCFKYLVPEDKHWADFVQETADLLKKYPHVRPELMGFPENWRLLLTKSKKKEKQPV